MQCIKENNMQPVTLYKVDPALNMRHFHRMVIQTDLFGKWSFIQEYGRIGRAGKMLAIPYDNAEQAEAAFSELLTAKQKKGYV